jgi:hypothetical protein
MTDDEIMAHHVRAVGDAIRRFDAAQEGGDEAFQPAFDRAWATDGTVLDENTEGTDYRMQMDDLLEASDALVKALHEAGTGFARRGDFLYEIVHNWDKGNYPGRHYRIRRVDLSGRSTGPGRVLHIE